MSEQVLRQHDTSTREARETSSVCVFDELVHDLVVLKRWRGVIFPTIWNVHAHQIEIQCVWHACPLQHVNNLSSLRALQCHVACQWDASLLICILGMLCNPQRIRQLKRDHSNQTPPDEKTQFHNAPITKSPPDKDLECTRFVEVYR